MNINQNFQVLLKLHPTIPYRVISRESNFLEFKEVFNWNSKDKYAKSIAAFANNKGGFLIFGVKSNPRNLVNLKSRNFESLDEARIAEYLNGVFSPEISWNKFVHEIKNIRIGVIFIQESLNKPIVCIKNDGVLKEAEIYYRYNGRSEKIKYPELIKLISEIREQERKGWTELIKKIAKIGPSNTAILDVGKGKIEGAGGSLVIEEKLIPKLNFIRQGKFGKKGIPTLKLMGDVKGAPIIGYKVRKISEEKLYKYSFTNLCEKLKISSYILTCLFWKFPELKKNEKYCHQFIMTPSNKPMKYNKNTLVFLKEKLYNLDLEKLKKEYQKHRRSS